MSDLHALIRACKDEPDDDAPRLILADCWTDTAKLSEFEDRGTARSQ